MHSQPTAQSVDRMNDLVARRWNEIARTIAFKDSWKTPLKLSKEVHARNIAQAKASEFGAFSINFDLREALNDPEVKALQPGDCAKSVDKEGRKMIFVGTSLGPVLVHDGSFDPKKPHYMAVTNAVLAMAGFAVRTTSLRHMSDIIGVTETTYEETPYITFNIGERMEEVYKMMAYPDYRPNTVRTRRIEPKSQAAAHA